MSELLPPVLVRFIANISEFQAKTALVERDLAAMETKASARIARMSAKIGRAMLPAAVVAGAAAYEGIKAAGAYEAVHVGLKRAIENTGNSFDAFKPQVDAAVSRMEKLGFNAQDTEDALKHLTLGLQDPNKALAVLGNSADLARSRNTTLRDSSLALARAMMGNTRALHQTYGIDLPMLTAGLARTELAHKALMRAQERYQEQSSKYRAETTHTTASQLVLKHSYENLQRATESYNEKLHFSDKVLAQVRQKMGGMAERESHTLQGATNAMKASMHDLFIEIGMALAPVVDKLAGLLAGLAHWMSQHKGIAQALAAVIGGVLVVAVTAYTVAMAGAAIETIAATWPILAIIAGLATLAAMFVYTYKHSKTFRDVLSVVVRAVGAIFALVIQAIISGLGLLLRTLGFVLKGIFSFASHATSFLSKAFGWIPGLGPKLKSANKFVKDFADTVTKDLDKAGGALQNYGSKAGNAVYGFSKNLSDSIDKYGKKVKKTSHDVGKTSGKSLLQGMSEGLTGAVSADLMPDGSKITYGVTKTAAPAKKAIQKLASELSDVAAKTTITGLRITDQQRLVNQQKTTLAAVQPALIAQTKALVAAAQAEEKKTRGTTLHTRALVALARAQHELNRAMTMTSPTMKAAAAADTGALTTGMGTDYLALKARTGQTMQFVYGADVNVPVHIDGQEIFKVTQKHSLRYDRRNISNGLALTGSVV